MKRSSALKIGGALAALLVILLGGYFIFGRSGTRASESLGTVTRGDLRQQVTIAGTVVSRRRTLVTAPYNGYVKKLYVKVGDQVKAGDPLVSVAQSLNVAEPVFPLRAPYAGTVMYVQKYEGEHAKGEDTNDFLLRLDDLSALFIQATTPEVDRLKLKVGQEAVIKASAVLDRPYKGVIRELTLAPKENTSSGNNQQSEYPVRVEVTERDKELGPGMSVVVDIITAEKEKVLQLPHEYVMREKDGYAVTMADGTRRPVKVGMQSEEAFEIVEGLAEGDRVRAVDFTSLPEVL